MQDLINRMIELKMERRDIFFHNMIELHLRQIHKLIIYFFPRLIRRWVVVLDKQGEYGVSIYGNQYWMKDSFSTFDKCLEEI